MKKFIVLSILGIVYAVLLTPVTVLFIWVATHVPETFDLGYYGLVFLLLTSMGISSSSILVIDFINYKTDLLD